MEKKEYNYDLNRDYWFIVINKIDNSVIINSILGLIKLTPNANNLPFQIKWKDNTEYKYDSISEKVSLFLTTLKKPKPSWKEEFLCNIRNLKLV